MSYPVHGVVDFADNAYKFPITRAEDPLTIMQQCHSLLRAVTPSHELVHHNGLWTVPFIQEMVERAQEWKPLLKTNASQHTRRDVIYKILQDRHKENALEALYDERFVPEQSTFCKQARAPQPTRRMVVDTAGLPSEIRGLAHLAQVQGVHLPLFGVFERNLGDLDSVCPCAPTVEDQVHGLGCCFDASAALEELLTQREVLTWSMEDGSVCYSLSAAATVRRILGDLPVDKQYAYDCASQHPSDLSGITPADTLAYFSETSGSDAEVDAVALLLFPKSGVSLSNLWFVNHAATDGLHEHDRLLHLYDGEHETVANILCSTETEQSHRDLALDAMPVVNHVAESPATTACVRYVFEYAWYHAVLEMQRSDSSPLRAEVQDDASLRLQLDDLLADTWEDIQKWAVRCEVKLKKLQSCAESSAFDVDYVRATAEESPANDQCPFVLEGTETQALQGVRAALSPGPCVVMVQDLTGDKTVRLYDPHACWSTECASAATTDMHGQKFLSTSMLTLCCAVFNPVEMLRDDEDIIPSVPSLSSTFMNQILHDPTFRSQNNFLAFKNGVDFLFPQNASASHQHQCFAPVPYWPQTWQAPFGEIVNSNYDLASGYPYMAAVTSDEGMDAPILEIAVIPDHWQVLFCFFSVYVCVHGYPR